MLYMRDLRSSRGGGGKLVFLPAPELVSSRLGLLAHKANALDPIRSRDICMWSLHGERNGPSDF